MSLGPSSCSMQPAIPNLIIYKTGQERQRRQCLAKLLSQQEAMRFLRNAGFKGISSPIMKAAVERGEIVVVRPGRRSYFTEASLLEWIQRKIGRVAENVHGLANESRSV
jgi:thermostable 8-oxoguanine DNA glycosylase